MALTFPKPLADLSEQLPIASARWRMRRHDEISGTGTSQILGINVADELWTARVQLHVVGTDEADQIAADIESLDGVQNTFLFSSPTRAFPQADPDGSILGANNPVINAIGVNNKSMKISGLAADYPLTKGDLMSFTWSADPVRHGFHRVVESVQADDTGLTSFFEVRPHFRPGTITTLPVRLISPFTRVMILPDTFQYGDEDGPVTRGMSFEVLERF